MLILMIQPILSLYVSFKSWRRKCCLLAGICFSLVGIAGAITLHQYGVVLVKVMASILALFYLLYSVAFLIFYRSFAR